MDIVKTLLAQITANPIDVLDQHPGIVAVLIDAVA
jgi:hypothetical protein